MKNIEMVFNFILKYDRKLIEYLNEFNAVSDILLQRLRGFVDGKTSVPLYMKLSNFTADIISNVNVNILVCFIVCLTTQKMFIVKVYWCFLRPECVC